MLNGTPGSFGLHKRPEGDDGMLDGPRFAPRGWSVIGSDEDGETYAFDRDLTLVRAGELRDWLAASGFRTYRVETDELAANFPDA